MKLIVTIISVEDAQTLIDALVQRGHRAALAGAPAGVLRNGSSVLLAGAPENRVDEVIAIIKEVCRTRTHYSNPLPPIMEPGEMFAPPPVETEAGGATVFVIDVDRFEQF
ncbi:MAG: cyclic-di-AMP receptor [Anaerolineae bacterium]